MSPILGIYASQISGHLSTNNFSSIATVTVGSGGASTITFSSIPSTYTHLQVRCTMKGSGNSLTLFQINGDTGANYSYHQLYGDGSSAGSAGSANVTQPFFGEVTTTTSVMGVAVIDYLDYANTNKYKTTRSLMGRDENGSGTVRLFSGSWRNTNAITSLSLYPDGGNSWQQYSSFALYGVK